MSRNQKNRERFYLTNNFKRSKTPIQDDEEDQMDIEMNEDNLRHTPPSGENEQQQKLGRSASD